MSHAIILKPRQAITACMGGQPDGWNTWLYDLTQRVNANIKGITAEVCTGICPDCDYVTWRRRGIALMPSLQLMPSWWDWWVCLRAGLLSGGIWTGRRNRTIESSEIQQGHMEVLPLRGITPPATQAVDCLVGSSSGGKTWGSWQAGSWAEANSVLWQPWMPTASWAVCQSVKEQDCPYCFGTH